LGGDGPPLLLVHGWPQTWYAWRLVMPALARDFQVIAPDQRGTGLSGKPPDGYDTGTLAADLVALMEELGHQRFAMVGHDTGMWIGYALAADHPDQLPDYAVRYYLDALSAGPGALHASFAIYRTLDTTIAQNQERKALRLSLPILAMGGAYSLGEQVGATMKLGADDVQTLVISGCAHWVAEESPEETLAALTEFLTPYRKEP
jgi:pimeloyl-ACP methyl ester carboxylesterase